MTAWLATISNGCPDAIGTPKFSYKLTWMDRRVFVRDLKGNLIREMRNEREGWGLTNDGTDLIYSDGSGSLFVADPQTFATKRTITVRSSTPLTSTWKSSPWAPASSAAWSRCP